LRFFDLIVPCGIADRKATSLEKLLGRGVVGREVATSLTQRFGEVFSLNMRVVSVDALLEILRQAERSQEAAAPTAEPILAVQERV
jgi:lipoate-protein ligase B